MGDVAKTATGAKHGNTVVVYKVRILFQVYPGVAGTDKQRGIAGVPYTVEIGPSNGFCITSEGVTAADGGIDLTIGTGDIATLRIFDTDYEISLRGSRLADANSLIGAQRRLGLLGYYLEEIKGGDNEKATLALLNFQADSNIDANGKLDAPTPNHLQTAFGE